MGSIKKDGFQQQLIDLSWRDPQYTLQSLVGSCGTEAAIMNEQFTYVMGVRFEGETPKGMAELIIPKSLYAVFPNVFDAWNRLYSEWVPTSGYELANLPCIEHYLGPDHSVRHELWVPIR